MKIKPFVKLLRLFDAKGYFLFCLFGFLLAKGFNFPLIDILIFWILIFLGAGFAFSINECFDQNEDKFNFTKENPILLKEVDSKKALSFSLFLAFLALIISFFYRIDIFLFCLFSFLLIFFYSSPPIRFKSRPILDLISHGLFGGSLLVIFPFLFFKTKINYFHYFIFSLVFFISVILELRNEYEDYESDKLGKVKTTCYFLGKERTKKLIDFLLFSYLSLLFLLFYLFLTNILYLFFIFTISYLFLFLFFKKQRFVKEYRLLDAYNVLIFLIILFSFI